MRRYNAIMVSTPPRKSLSIDGFLSEEERQLLYTVWKANPNFPPVLVYNGGIEDITCDLILEVGEETFKKAFGRRKKHKQIAEKIWEVAKQHG